MSQTIKNKIANIWYYYKYYLLAALLAVIVLAVAVKGCAEKKDYDVNLLFIHGYSESFYQTDGIASALGSFAEDGNGDGITDVQIITINYGNTVQDSNNASAARSANLAAGKNVLFLLDEQNYNELKAGGFLAELSELGESEYLEGDRFDAVESGLFSEVSGLGADGQKYYLCLRVYDSTKAKYDKSYDAQYNAAKSLITNILGKY